MKKLLPILTIIILSSCGFHAGKTPRQKHYVSNDDVRMRYDGVMVLKADSTRRVFGTRQIEREPESLEDLILKNN